MELKGKKIAFLGDSITQGIGVSGVESTFWNELGRRTGAQVYGYGISGTRIANQQHPDFGITSDRYFASRVDNMIPDADIVVVFGGTNDYGHGDAPLGCMTDRRDDTFYGACHMLIQKLMNRYPEAQLVFMTPLHRVDEERMSDACDFRCLKRYVEVIREVTEFYGVVVVDLFATCQIQPQVPISKEKYMPDGLHPNDAGHQLIANRLHSVLNAL